MKKDDTPVQNLAPYRIFVDTNAGAGSLPGGRRYVCSKSNLEESVEECKRLTTESILSLYTPQMTAAELNYAYLEAGADPFIVGAPYVPFSARSFARDCCCAITGEAIAHPTHSHPCDKIPPPRLTQDPNPRPVAGSWRKDTRCIHYLPNPYAEACRLAEMQGSTVLEKLHPTAQQWGGTWDS